MGQIPGIVENRGSPRHHRFGIRERHMLVCMHVCACMRAYVCVCVPNRGSRALSRQARKYTDEYLCHSSKGREEVLTSPKHCNAVEMPMHLDLCSRLGILEGRH